VSNTSWHRKLLHCLLQKITVLLLLLSSVTVCKLWSQVIKKSDKQGRQFWLHTNYFTKFVWKITIYSLLLLEVRFLNMGNILRNLRAFMDIRVGVCVWHGLNCHWIFSFQYYEAIPKYMYTLSNKNPSAWNFLSPEPELTCRTAAIIIRVVLFSPYLRIRGVSLSSTHYKQSHRLYINRR